MPRRSDLRACWRLFRDNTAAGVTRPDRRQAFQSLSSALYVEVKRRREDGTAFPDRHGDEGTRWAKDEEDEAATGAWCEGERDRRFAERQR